VDLKKKLLIVIIVIAGFVFGVSFSTLYAQVHIAEGTACSCTLPIPLLIPTFSSLGVFVGSIVYYMLSPAISREVQKVDTKAILDLLEPLEKEIIRRIVENKGEISQSKLSTEFGKVKAFRVIEALKNRGVVEKVPYGKTNKIKLNEKFVKLFE
jgi:uncharacterized membrane protein